jgi:hypothetical protein
VLEGEEYIAANFKEFRTPGLLFWKTYYNAVCAYIDKKISTDACASAGSARLAGVRERPRGTLPAGHEPLASARNARWNRCHGRAMIMRASIRPISARAGESTAR